MEKATASKVSFTSGYTVDELLACAVEMYIATLWFQTVVPNQDRQPQPRLLREATLVPCRDRPWPESLASACYQPCLLRVEDAPSFTNASNSNTKKTTVM